ncbi:hypothetical protein [Rickettsiales endosymbiont of Trichoplax sp. H2]|uniref:hypothetical protein n=1 Tax=Rickettsiales endosymbiont of Trichoplax sp. H2 TaxID=2021221 RepID=UPI0012B35DF0|nr:hypothetical protein [Rickettsiales endosymbiont of Trichoplax sp. H2]MSO14219.1 hypothetical protein [Rickettsiales endosymbiont of Trichoplax sp. H2]
MNLAFEQRFVMYDGYGSLSYLDKPLYLVKSINEPSNSSVKQNYSTITPNPLEDPLEQYRGYEFFMFRLINGQNSFNTEPNYKITFDKQANESYQKSDVVGTFKYHNANSSMIKAYLLEGDTFMVNPVAEKILVQEKNHLVDMIKSVFNKHYLYCNKLKNIPDNLIIKITNDVCIHRYEAADKDFLINIINCNEIFTLAKDDELCPYHDSLDNFGTT